MGAFDRLARRPIRRSGDTFVVQLDPEERELIGSFVDQLRQLVTTDSSLLARLFPPPYGDDEERNAGYSVLAGAELVERRLAAFDEVTEHLDATELSEEQLLAWMRSINDIRLVIGTMLDVTEDDRVDDFEDTDDAVAYGVYEYFGGLLEMIVAALSD